MRRDVTRLTRQLSLAEKPVPQLVNLVDDFRRSLLRIRSETPGSRLYHLGNLEKAGKSRWRTRYWTAHLSWHQCNCDLFRSFLRGYREAAHDAVLRTVTPEYVSNAASLCLEHATSIIQIIADIDQRSDDGDVMEFDNAICAYHAARIVLFMSSSRADAQFVTREDAITQAHICFTYLRRFFSTVPMATSIIVNLETRLSKATRGQEDQINSGSSSDWDENVADHNQQLSRVARASQRLGVHSVVRQAQFVDDSYSWTSDGTKLGSQSSTSLHNKGAPSPATIASAASMREAGSNAQVPSPTARPTSSNRTATQDIWASFPSESALGPLASDFLSSNNVDFKSSPWMTDWQHVWASGGAEQNADFY
jgi:hypothetical protein